MGLSKVILNIALFLVDTLTWWIRPKEDRITFVSLTQDHLSSDFLLLDEALRKETSYDLHYNLISFQKSIKGQMEYFFNCLKQMVEYKKSKLVILNDNNYVISQRRPKHCQVLQVWHACGAVKKFGNEIKREYPIQNYTAVIANAEAWKEIYARSFGVEKEQVYVTGMPRTDQLLKTKKEAFLQRYPQCRNKKVALYAPTFRGNIIHGFQVASFDIPKVAKECSDWIILYKFHPLLGDVQVDEPQAINGNQEDLYELMQVSDCLISDYSSVILDYSLLKKPIIAYLPDVEEYAHTIGMNLPLEEYPGPICEKEEELIDVLHHMNSYDFTKEEKFQKTYMTYTDGKNTQRVVQLIQELMQK